MTSSVKSCEIFCGTNISPHQEKMPSMFILASSLRPVMPRQFILLYLKRLRIGNAWDIIKEQQQRL